MKTEVIVIGAGGHAKVCIELLQAQGDTVACCVGNPDSPDTCVGIPVLKSDDHLSALFNEGYRRAFVAIGANAVRNKLAAKATALGFTLVNAVSPAATVSPSARLGAGVAVMAGAVINAEATIADLCIVNTGATIDHDCILGQAVHIAPQCALAGNVQVGDLSFIGVGSKIIPQIRIGESSMVGAGSVVISNVGSAVTVVGVPAKALNKF
ncbi:acetyltransferase [Pseudomonas sp. COR58]|uniref:Acetyltransferase n=1 Tax=Pseudomonas ekonensis TaxID=2842353 RepID=A0ABS6PA62_9PSED|nr:acetyltransferase [Pseudomonas ekonensis]MBV4457365.1 acetyltransferase [Pseudomonas ekonensis]